MLWSKIANITFVASPAQSWIDDYFDWAKDCCTYNLTTNEVCQSNPDLVIFLNLLDEKFRAH